MDGGPGLPAFVLAINLSPVQFRRGNVEAVVGSALAACGLDPALLELELTESTLIQDSEKFIVSLQKLKAMGLRIAHRRLRHRLFQPVLPAAVRDRQAQDRPVLRAPAHGGPQEQAIVSAIIQIARSLQLTTTAEGIEDEATRQRLAELGCLTRVRATCLPGPCRPRSLKIGYAPVAPQPISNTASDRTASD